MRRRRSMLPFDVRRGTVFPHGSRSTQLSDVVANTQSSTSTRQFVLTFDCRCRLGQTDKASEDHMTRVSPKQLVVRFDSDPLQLPKHSEILNRRALYLGSEARPQRTVLSFEHLKCPI